MLCKSYFFGYRGPWGLHLSFPCDVCVSWSRGHKQVSRFQDCMFQNSNTRCDAVVLFGVLIGWVSSWNLLLRSWTASHSAAVITWLRLTLWIHCLCYKCSLMFLLKLIQRCVCVLSHYSHSRSYSLSVHSFIHWQTCDIIINSSSSRTTLKFANLFLTQLWCVLQCYSSWNQNHFDILVVTWAKVRQVFSIVAWQKAIIIRQLQYVKMKWS